MLQWCYYKGVTMVLQWCYNIVKMVLQWRLPHTYGVTVVSQCYSDVTVVLQCCYSGVPVMSQ
jgi:hypothetical protein